MNCRHCRAELKIPFVDLGTAPPSNAYIAAHALGRPEVYYPLRVLVCSSCWLVQTEDYPAAQELFGADYAYLSSASKSWLDHAARYCQAAAERLRLDRNSFVIEIASNDGYLLKNFVASGIPCLGIEPTAGTAAVAERAGVPVLREFFGHEIAVALAAEGKQADLIVANNVYAHVPDINDFSAGLKKVLKPNGTITLEFAHLLRLVEQGQFDTIYHEHFSYLSLHTVSRILGSAGLRVFDVEPLPTHGGSLRVYACHADDGRAATAGVRQVLAAESEGGLQSVATYRGFQDRADAIKNALLSFLIARKHAGESIAAYGAAAKGNTLLNYAGVKPDLLPHVFDAAPSKQGKFLPGSRVPILAPSMLRQLRPDYLLLLPWNLADELAEQCSHAREWGARFVIAVPTLRVREDGQWVPLP